ncbi:MAG: adenylate/guanylate cyclase domain-containing protein [Candidatus Gastranaerophilales bacterium]
MKIFKQKLFFIKAGILHLLLITVISIVSILLWENNVRDFIQLQLATPSYSNQIAIITIDDESLKTYRWPWKRSLYAEMFSYFSENTSAKALVFDSVLNTLDADAPDDDKQFFETVKSIPNYIGGYMALIPPYNNKEFGQEYDKKFEEKFAIKVNDLRSNYYKTSKYYNSLSAYPDPYFNALEHVGSVNINTDSDTVLRKSNDMISYNDQLYPSLALSTYLHINNANSITISDKYMMIDQTGLKVPIYNNRGKVQHIIKYHIFIPDTEYSHKQYSAIDIINSKIAIRNGEEPIINPKEFEGKIIFVGANVKAQAMGLADLLETPISMRHPGVDIQATILENLLNDDFIVNTTFGTNVLTIFILSLITFIIIRFFSFVPSLILQFVVAIIYFIFCIICFNNNLAPLIITPIAAQLSTMVFGYSYRFILEGRNKEKIKNAMGRYLSQDIMQNVVQNIDNIKLGGKKANVTVLFADIRGFTSMSEKMTAEEVSIILNEYFSEIEPIITKYNGVINKFIGDAVMAIFGEPIQDIDHPSKAVACAYDMLKRVEELQDKWIAEGKPKIEIGIGINTGEAFVGNIGSEKRLEYTVIGDMVNLASRIESYNKVYKTNLLISSSTYSHVSSITNVIKISDVTIRGKAKKMDIYEVLKVDY